MWRSLLPWLWGLGCCPLSTYAGRGLSPGAAPDHANGCDLNSPPGGLHFLAVGDWGKPGSAQQRVVAEMAKEAGRANSSRFALLVGDNFYPSGVDTWDDTQFRTTYSEVLESKSALHFPHFAVLGNHDYYKNPQAQVDRHYKVQNSYWRMPSRWYTQEFALGCSPEARSERNTSALFIFLDTMILAAGYRENGIEDTQRGEHWEWLQNTLENATADWIIVVGHHPVYSAGWHGDQKDLATKLAPLLNHYGIDAYISGHDHDEQLILGGTGVDDGGPAYIVSGTGSKVRRWGWSPHTDASLSFYEKYYGFISLSINTTHLSSSHISDSGETRYRHVQRLRTKRHGTILERVVPPDVIYRRTFYVKAVLVVLLLCSICCGTFCMVRRKRRLWNAASDEVLLAGSTELTASY